MGATDAVDGSSDVEGLEVDRPNCIGRNHVFSRDLGGRIRALGVLGEVFGQCAVVVRPVDDVGGGEDQRGRCGGLPRGVEGYEEVQNAGRVDIEISQRVSERAPLLLNAARCTMSANR